MLSQQTVLSLRMPQPLLIGVSFGLNANIVRLIACGFYGRLNCIAYSQLSKHQTIQIKTLTKFETNLTHVLIVAFPSHQRQ
jgi:hypothetical protein